MSKSFSSISNVIALLLLSVGGLIYLCYRPLSLNIFRWTNLSESTLWLAWMRENRPSNLPDWVIYALPDGLWTCSYVIFIGVIWKFSLRECLPIALIIPAVGIGSELMQLFGLLPGKFDFADLICYTVGTCVGLLYISLMNRQT